MNKNTQNDITQNFLKVAKRIAITVVACIPFLIVFAYLTRKIITNNVLQILIFIAVFGVAVLIEEIIVRKKEKRKKALSEIEIKRDVFK